MDLKIGTLFNTPFEQGCKVTSTPDRDGNFTALDSEGVECGFCLPMVHSIVECRYSVAHLMGDFPAVEIIPMGRIGDVACCQACADFYRKLQGE